jgi:hypothetical protein
MSTSALYRTLGIRSYMHRSIRQQEENIVLRVRHDGNELKCPCCSSSHISCRATGPRRWTAPQIGNRLVTVFADVLWIECDDCGTDPVPFADPRSLERMVLDLRQSMTLGEYCTHLSFNPNAHRRRTRMALA